VPFVLYGGSVAAENVMSFTHMADIDGVLVSTHSLDPDSFIKIVDNA
jgi:triosephosphate isomerase